MEIELIPQQSAFLKSDKRFPCFAGGIGTGKTYMLLLKGVSWCQSYAGSTTMIVRKEFTDLRDSTIIDFKRYFGIEPNSSRDVNFENGSKIMFRHAGEINHANLKNMTLDWVGIEQAEELDDDTPFAYIRDRMRGKAHPDGLQQIAIIANANGHNWIWRRWIYEPESAEFEIVIATTFDNEKNLPVKFVADMRAREKSEPRHFRRMVMNSFDEDLADDNVFSTRILQASVALNFKLPNFVRYVAGLDVGRYGDDPSCLVILAQCGIKIWKQVYMEERKGKSVPEVAGWVKDVWNTFPFDVLGVDDVGVGGGVTDLLNDSHKYTCYGFIANEKLPGVSPYPNKKVAGYFKLEEMISKEWLQILNNVHLHEEMMSIKFYYRQDSTKYIVSKDEMKSKGMKSPNKAEALMIAAFYAEEDMGLTWDNVMVPGVVVGERTKAQEYAKTWDS